MPIRDVARAILNAIARPVVLSLEDLDWRTILVGQSDRQPQFRAYTTWTVAQLRNAELQADGGDLRLAAELCEAMLGDERIAGCGATRVNALLGSELDFETGRGRRKKAAVKAIEAGEDWWTIFPDPTLAQVLLWGRLLGIGPTQFNWREFPDHGNRVLGVSEFWHPRNIRYDWRDRAWKTLVGDYGTQEAVMVPGGGKWGLYMPYGSVRPWSMGLWRGLARLWLLKQYAIDDWGKASEVYGMPMKVVTSPFNPNKGPLGDVQSPNADARKQRRKQLADDIAAMGRDSTIALPPGFEMDLVQATADTEEMFEKQIAMANTAIAIAWLGANLPTEVSQGAGTGATAQTLVRLDYKKSDANTLATWAHDDNLVLWSEFNFGGREYAPWPTWLVEPATDRKAEAEVLVSLAKAIGDLLDANIPVDVQELAERFDLPLRTIEDTLEQQAASKLFEYHFKYKIITINEARARLGLPPIPGGDVPAEPPAQASILASAPSNIEALGIRGTSPDAVATEAQRYVDQVAERYGLESGGAMGELLSAVSRAIESSASYDELADKLAAIAADERLMVSPKLQTVIENAILAAAAAGAAAVGAEAAGQTFPAGGSVTRPETTIEYHRSRSPLTEARWTALTGEAKTRSTTAAWVAALVILNKVKSSAATAQASEKPFDEWRAEQLDRSADRFYLAEVLRANAQSGYGAGRHAAATMPAILAERPYWKLVVVLDNGTTEYCRPLANPPVILPATDPWWTGNLPPRHPGCRTTFVTLTAAQARREGITPVAPRQGTAPGWGSSPSLSAWRPKASDFDPALWRATQSWVQEQS